MSLFHSKNNRDVDQQPTLDSTENVIPHKKKIKFVDEIKPETSVVDIVNVESYKKFNIDYTEPTTPECECHCTVF